MATARVLRRAVDAVCWSGQMPIQSMRCCYPWGSESLILCKTHSPYEANQWHYRKALLSDVNGEDYDPDKVLQLAHDARFGPNSGHFTARDPLWSFIVIGSLFAYKVGTLPLMENPPIRGDKGEIVGYTYHHSAYIDKNALNIKALHARTRSADVFKDWPVDFTVNPGYTFWCVPLDVEKEMTYQVLERPATRICRNHACNETVVLDRDKYIRVKMMKGASREEAEKAADAVQFKVAVELDFSSIGVSNLVIFLPPKDARDPEKVVAEMSNPKLHGFAIEKGVDMSEMRLVPHPRFKHCPATNWFKVVPKGELVSWEADGYWKKVFFYKIP